LFVSLSRVAASPGRAFWFFENRVFCTDAHRHWTGWRDLPRDPVLATARTPVDVRGLALSHFAISPRGRYAVDIDTDKIDEAVLALLYLTLHEGFRAWKGHDWDAMDRLYRKGMIDDPVGKAKSVVLTDEGLAESERLFRRLFERSKTTS
jgi:hypothetical protein